MERYFKKKASIGVPSDAEAKAEEGTALFKEDEATLNGSTKCRRCGYEDENGASECPNCGSNSMRKAGLGRKLISSNPITPTKEKTTDQDRVFTFFRGMSAIKHGPIGDGGDFE